MDELQPPPLPHIAGGPAIPAGAWCRACAIGYPQMQSALHYLSIAAVAAVVLVLLAGFWNMMRGSSANRSQILMRWRVGLQFLAIVIAMIAVYFLRP
jgi:hypothetical protein